MYSTYVPLSWRHDDFYTGWAGDLKKRWPERKTSRVGRLRGVLAR
jgi:hypothetical protein